MVSHQVLKNDSDVQVMVLYRNFTIHICTGCTEVGYSPPTTLQFLQDFKTFNREAMILQHTSGCSVAFVSFCRQ